MQWSYSTLHPQHTEPAAGQRTRRVSPADDDYIGASMESSRCGQCAFRAGCLVKLMSKQMCGASEEACCVKKQMRDIPETLQDNMGQKMRHS